jgi:hypothetical protein
MELLAAAGQDRMDDEGLLGAPARMPTAATSREVASDEDQHRVMADTLEDETVHEKLWERSRQGKAEGGSNAREVRRSEPTDLSWTFPD